jgi:hypothetical protein
LLHRDHETNPRIAEAVANQGDAADAEALRTVAELSNLPAIRSYFLDLARRTTSVDRCEKR